MSRRYFVDSPIVGETAVLTGQEAQHLTKVMRAKVGDQLTLFDGSGAEFSAHVERIGRAEVTLGGVQRREIDRELPFQLVLAVALPKGDRQRWLVEKLVELGVRELVPLVTARSVAQPSGNALERLRRAVVEASKQCGRNRLMEIGPARKITELLHDESAASERLIAVPDATGHVGWTRPVSADRIIVAIGPEGGFTDEEVSLANSQQWNRVSLGARVLRTETAAVAMAAVLALRVPRNEPR